MLVKVHRSYIALDHVVAFEKEHRHWELTLVTGAKVIVWDLDEGAKVDAFVKSNY